MIVQLLQAYLDVLIPIGLGALVLFSAGVYWILRPSSMLMPPSVQPAKMQAIPNVPAPTVDAFAGASVFATQLDLARAYLETGKHEAVKPILQQVLEAGSPEERQEAQQLLATL